MQAPIKCKQQQRTNTLVFVLALASTLLALGSASARAAEYSYDDGVSNVTFGPPNSFEQYGDIDMLWGNYYFTAEPAEVLTSVRFGLGDLSAGERVTIWVFDDPDNDADPTNAVPLGSLRTTGQNLGFDFNEIDWPPTVVEDGFFVAVGHLAELTYPGGQPDYPAPGRYDPDGRADRSWFFYDDDIPEDDLAASGFVQRMDGPFVPIPGAFAIRAITRAVTPGACCSAGACTDVADETMCQAFVCDVSNITLPHCQDGDCDTDCFGDVNGDGVVTPADRGFISANINNASAEAICLFDLDGNGTITPSDRGYVAANVGVCTPLPDFQDGSGLNGGAPDGRFGPSAFMGAGTTCAEVACDEPPSGMVLVPGGTFEMGDPFLEGGADELPVHEVHLSPYSIDQTEVTNQQYAEALNWALKQGYLISVIDGTIYQADDVQQRRYGETAASSIYSRVQWDGVLFSADQARADHPMLMVTWYGAAAYCNWRSAMEGRPLAYDTSTFACDFGSGGYRLPTEAEWEKAAAWDPVEQRHLRFGEHSDGCGFNCLDGDRANCLLSGDPFAFGNYPWTTPTGYYNGTNQGGYPTQDGRSYYGCFDMSGNVWEWCNDWYVFGYHNAGSSDDPTGPDDGTVRVLRGGSWVEPASAMRSAARNANGPGNRFNNVGFRAAISQ